MDNKSRSRLNGMLGFAMRAGKVVIGTDLVCTSMASKGKGRARLVLLTKTASDGTKRKITFKSEFYGIETRIIDMEGSELGRLLGKLYAPAVVAITDDRFAEEIRKATDSYGDSEIQQ